MLLLASEEHVLFYSDLLFLFLFLTFLRYAYLLPHWVR